MLLELVLLCCVLLLMIYAIIQDRRPPNMPPGPFDLPLVGQRPIVTEEEGVEIRKRYGDIITQRLGNVRTVVLFNFDDVKELFSKPEFAARPDFFRRFNFNDTENHGILFSSGGHWAHSRKFIQKQLRELGTTGSGGDVDRLEQAIHEEARALVHHLKKTGDQPTLYPHCFEICVLNVLWQFVASRRYELDAEEVCKIFHMIEGIKLKAGETVLMGLFPFLTWLPNIVQQTLMGQRHLQSFLQHMRSLFVKCVEEHRSTLDCNHGRDFIDDYLIEMADQNILDDHSAAELSIEALYQLLLDLFNTGSDTVSHMLHWVVYYSVRYPHIASRCRDYIDNTVSRDQIVSLAHRKRLPYLEAFMSEVLRCSSMVVYMPQRMATKDATLAGYFIPKGTAITTCSSLINYDPTYWKDPNIFRPERFLDAAGDYKVQRDGFMPFGIGRRQCAGETLARSELFVFIATLLQNFTVELPEGATLADKPFECLGLRSPTDQPFVYRYRT